MQKIPNYHVLKVSFIGPTAYKPARVKITSERFEMARIIEYDYEFNDTRDVAEHWLQVHGFNIIGHGEGKDHYYVITDTFEPLPENK